uniref:Secreted protein n=1 Tax=Rhabditophanes sp. KR3021 TaxID=114890 RepID=A0AC35UE33_9BILA
MKSFWNLCFVFLLVVSLIGETFAHGHGGGGHGGGGHSGGGHSHGGGHHWGGHHGAVFLIFGMVQVAESQYWGGYPGMGYGYGYRRPFYHRPYYGGWHRPYYGGYGGGWGKK